MSDRKQLYDDGKLRVFSEHEQLRATVKLFGANYEGVSVFRRTDGGVRICLSDRLGLVSREFIVNSDEDLEALEKAIRAIRTGELPEVESEEVTLEVFVSRWGSEYSVLRVKGGPFDGDVYRISPQISSRGVVERTLTMIEMLDVTKIVIDEWGIGLAVVDNFKGLRELGRIPKSVEIVGVRIRRTSEDSYDYVLHSPLTN